MALIQTQTRRGFLGGITAAGAAGLIRAPRAEAADGPLETTTVRFQKPGSLCVPSLYIAEQRLRADGFTEIRYIDPPYPGAIGPVPPRRGRFFAGLCQSVRQGD